MAGLLQAGGGVVLQQAALDRERLLRCLPEAWAATLVGRGKTSERAALEYGPILGCCWPD